MLELRPTCEHCNKALPFDATDAMICSFECTFCADCSDHVLQEICPNCGGHLVKRPIRPKSKMEKYPASTKEVHRPVDLAQHAERIKVLASIPPQLR